MQAQNDAVGIRKYLIEEAGFAPDNCILLSDLSTSTEHEAVYPDRLAINDWLETVCQGRVQSDDTLWFYFSGYGAQADNKDYLMPVDGDPAQVKQTGIALEEVVRHLQQSPTKNTMMVLDMNRSQSALAGQAIGEQVVKLAKKARIPLILSCQPNEFSHETLAVRHGLFTAALLEGLRYDGCATLSHLERYLLERLPELCEHHWRPIQNPVVELPEEQKFRLLWHQRDTVAPETVVPDAVADESAGLVDEAAMIPDGPDPYVEDFVPDEESLLPEGLDNDFEMEELIPDPDLEPIEEFILEDELPEEPQREPFDLEPLESEVDDPDAYGTTLTEDLPDVEPKKGNVNGCLGALAALIALLLLGAVLFRNQPVVKNALNQLPPGWLASLGLDTDSTIDDPTTPDGVDGEPVVEPPVDQPETDGEVTAEAPEADGTVDNPDDPDAETPDNPDAETPDDPDAETPDDPDAETGEAELDVDLDELGLDVDEPGEGPEETPDNPDAGPVAAAGNTVGGSSGEDTAALLEEARRTLRPSQASRFASAIATARKIPPGDPNYNQAQADIQRWSRVILDLAEGRAAESELDAAINAAKLIPREPADVYQAAQERISFWEARAQTRALIREAQAIPRTGQASTYQKGILKLQEVPADQPIEYGDAQRLIGEWTGKMLGIAQARAAQGRYDSAIEAAALIPRDTPNYDQAQAEIKRWQGQ